MTVAARFTKADMKRAVSGVIAAGVPVRKVEVDPNGKIVILIGLPNQGQEDDDEWGDLR
jgi:hypothetical protein